MRKKEQAAKKNEQDGVKTQNDGNTDVDRLIYISDLMKRVQETCH